MRGAIALVAVVMLATMAAPTPARARAAGHSQRLAARARRGDRAARAALVEAHMGLVRSIAFRYRDLGLPSDDLVQEAAIGLLAAIDDYDPERGTSFSTYAFWRIRAAVTHALTARGSLVRIPRSVREGRHRVVTTGPDGPLHEGTLESAWPSDDPSTQPEVAVLAGERTRAVARALRRLRPHKRAILRRHFGIDGEPETLTAIAADLHLSPERTRALKDEALHELATELEPV
jgi:RNA polymerase sigma factor (sigma-70 family)